MLLFNAHRFNKWWLKINRLEDNSLSHTQFLLQLLKVSGWSGSNPGPGWTWIKVDMKLLKSTQYSMNSCNHEVMTSASNPSVKHLVLWKNWPQFGFWKCIQWWICTRWSCGPGSQYPLALLVMSPNPLVFLNQDQDYEPGCGSIEGSELPCGFGPGSSSGFFSCFVLFVWVFFLDQDVMYLFLSSGLDAVKEAGGSDVMSEVQQWPLVSIRSTNT